MRFFVAAVSVLSIAGLALGAPVNQPVATAMQPGNVPMVKPIAWGSTNPRGNRWPHPAAVLSNHGGIARVAQLTHSPIAGQKVIETGRIAPSMDRPDNHGRKSYIDLNPQRVNTNHQIPGHGNSMNVKGRLSPHEHNSLMTAVRTVPFKINAGNHAAVLGKQKTGLRTAAQHAAAAGSHKSNLRSVAHAAADAAKARNARLGHHV
jgi:hypothetical protein